MSASDVELPSDVDVDITVASQSASIRQRNLRKRPAAAASSGGLSGRIKVYRVIHSIRVSHGFLTVGAGESG